MSDIHIMQGKRGDTWTAVYHFQVPATNNSIGVSWRDALVGAGLNTTILIEGTEGWQISIAELVSIVDGSVLEYVDNNVRIDSGGASGANRIAMLEAQYTKVKTQVLSDLQANLKYFGFVRNIGG